MNTYVPYTRTTEGTIERNNHVTFCWQGPLGPYQYEDTLVGWPESKVFWQHEKGYSVGLALQKP